MRDTIDSIQLTVFYATLSLIFLFAIGPNCYAQETTGVNEISAVPGVTGETYAYAIEGRPDPFKPFISPKAATPAGRDPNEIVDEGKELSGMQLFEPGQLTLVGVMMTESGEVALVEDQTKKGYMLKQGLPVGRRGIVTLIDKSQVVITETARTRAGKEINSTVIMRLNKEGDK
ncbi:MAG: pilus assembly protein PilP [Chlorobium sp.]|jgi:type IV pilus assembly protein PilP|nr:pilus assembly protein PilP [Chlorobium sp.]